MVNVIISGASGRLGHRITQQCLAASDIEITAALVRPGSSSEGHCVQGSQLRMTSDVDRALAVEHRPVLIETALVPVALEHLAQAVSHQVPVCIATTGFSTKERRQIERQAQSIPVLWAPNLSPGVTVLTELVRQATKALEGYHLEVLELHHAKKRDAPSGTAWALAEAGAAARGRDLERDAILARAGDIGPRGEHEVGLQSIRGGDIVGEHTVYLVAENERVELTHRSMSRDAFAAGAVPAARFLAQDDLAPGLYSMRDVLGL